MKLINPKYNIIEQGNGIHGIYDMIAKCAAVCYQSEAKEGEKAKDFVQKLINNNHDAALEFGTVFFEFDWPFVIATNSTPDGFLIEKRIAQMLMNSPYSKFSYKQDGGIYLTTNYRVVIETAQKLNAEFYWEVDTFDEALDIILSFRTEGTPNHPQRRTVNWIADIGTMREVMRHRKFSYLQESTRWCNYCKDKFDGDLTFIKPIWFEYDYGYGLMCKDAEKHYYDLIGAGLKPQAARYVLPLGLKAETNMCGFEDDWNHFFQYRSDIEATGPVHPELKHLATEIREYFRDRGWYKD